MNRKPAMKRILILGAGGPPGINVIRSWREAPEPFYIVGTDMNPFHLEWVPADRVYLVPPVDHPEYLDVVAEIVERERIDLIHAQPDVEVRVLSENRERFPARVFLPRKETIRLLQDKQASAERWREAGIHTFPTVPIETPEDLERAVEIIGLPLWLRAREGAGARGATLVERIETGIHWIAYWRSRGVNWAFIAQPYFRSGVRLAIPLERWKAHRLAGPPADRIHLPASGAFRPHWNQRGDGDGARRAGERSGHPMRAGRGSAGHRGVQRGPDGR